MPEGRAGLALVAGALALAGCVVYGGSFSVFGPVLSGSRPAASPGPTTAPRELPASTPGSRLAGEPEPAPGRLGAIAEPGSTPMPEVVEEPLAPGGAIAPLQPAPPMLASEAERVYFGNGSPFFVWRDEPGESLMVGEVGGAIRRLGPWNHGPWGPRFADGGRHLLVEDFVSRPSDGEVTGVARRLLIYPLAGGDPIVAAELAAGTAESPYDPLPDGSGLTRLADLASGGPPVAYRPTPNPAAAPAAVELVTRLPGKADEAIASLTATRHGAWSLDSRVHASVGYRNADPLQGMDIVILDRETKSSRLLYHLETDYFSPAEEGNFRWTPDGRVAFAIRFQHGASASVAVTAIPARGGAAEISLFPLRLQKDEFLGTVLMSPDAGAVAFTVMRTVWMTVAGWGLGMPMSQGVHVGDTLNGRVRKLTDRGRPLAWLPDGRHLICATGRGRHARYYLVDTGESTGGER